MNFQKQNSQTKVIMEEPQKVESKRPSGHSLNAEPKKKENIIKEIEKPVKAEEVETHPYTIEKKKKSNSVVIFRSDMNKTAMESEHNAVEEFHKSRTKVLQDVMRHYMRLDFDRAIPKAWKLFEMSRDFFEEEDNQDIYDFLADGLLLVKCLLAGENLSKAREQLLELWEITKEYISDDRIDYKELNIKGGKLRPKYLELNLLKNFVDHETLSLSRKNEINE